MVVVVSEQAGKNLIDDDFLFVVHYVVFFFSVDILFGYCKAQRLYFHIFPFSSSNEPSSRLAVSYP